MDIKNVKDTFKYNTKMIKSSMATLNAVEQNIWVGILKMCQTK